MQTLNDVDEKPSQCGLLRRKEISSCYFESFNIERAGLIPFHKTVCGGRAYDGSKVSGWRTMNRQLPSH